MGPTAGPGQRVPEIGKNDFNPPGVEEEDTRPIILVRETELDPGRGVTDYMERIVHFETDKRNSIYRKGRTNRR